MQHPVASVRHQDGQATVSQNMARHSRQQHLAEATMRICAHNQQGRRLMGRNLQEFGPDGACDGAGPEKDGIYAMPL